MSLIDQNSILPGVITEIESDYSSDYDTSLFGTTDSVVIIGTAHPIASIKGFGVPSVIDTHT